MSGPGLLCQGAQDLVRVTVLNLAVTLAPAETTALPVRDVPMLRPRRTCERPSRADLQLARASPMRHLAIPLDALPPALDAAIEPALDRTAQSRDLAALASEALQALDELGRVFGDAASAARRPAPSGLSSPMRRSGDPDGTGTPADDGADEAAQPAPGQARESDLLPFQMLSRGGISLSAGYSSIEGPIGSIKLSRTNIGAPGRDITASARYSKVQTLAELGMSDANLLGSGLTVAPSIFYSRSTAVGFDRADSASLFVQTARGANLYLARPLAHGFRLAANYRYSQENFFIDRPNAQCARFLHGALFCDALGRQRSSVFSVALSFDRRDRAVDPKRAYQLRLSQDIAGSGGTTRFIRFRGSANVRQRIGSSLDLSLGLEGGYIKGLDGQRVPLFDRFFIGGNSMRGFDLRGLGPKIVPTGAPPGHSTAIGGRAYYVGRLELSVRLEGASDRFGIAPSLFVDAGSVFGANASDAGPGETLIGNSAKPRVAVGVGVALSVPVGKLRFNLAQPVVRQPGDRARHFSITFGTAF